MQAVSISVAMSTYNGGRFLGEQLRSIANQTVLPYELVITDDGSLDNTIDMIEKFAKSAPFVVRLHKNSERLGYRKNFLRCAGLCRSDVIAFCDQDDIWHDGKLRAVSEAFEKAGCVLVFHNAIVKRDGIEIGSLYPSHIFLSDTTTTAKDVIFSPLGFTISFRRELVSYNRLHGRSRDPNDFLQREAHDQWIYFLAQSIGAVVYVDRHLAIYRQHSGNVHGWGNRSFIRKWLRNIRQSARRQINLFLCVDRRLDALDRLLKSNPQSEKIKRARHSYGQLEKVSRFRMDAYAHKSIAMRFGSFGRLMVGGCYGRSAGELSLRWRGLARDLLLIPVFAICLKRKFRSLCAD